MSEKNDNKVPNVPNLRFSSFSDEWTTSLLKDSASFYKGTGISKEELSEEGHPCILYGELYTTYKTEKIKDVKSKTSKVRRKTKTLNSYALGRRNPKRILLRTQKGN